MLKKRTLITIGVILTLVSAWIISLGASEEPYLVFHPFQALIQVGVGSALLLLWVQWIGVVAWQVMHRSLPSIWLGALVWAFIVMVYLSQAPISYIQDLSGFSVCR